MIVPRLGYWSLNGAWCLIRGHGVLSACTESSNPAWQLLCLCDIPHFVTDKAQSAVFAVDVCRSFRYSSIYTRDGCKNSSGKLL